MCALPENGTTSAIVNTRKMMNAESAEGTTNEAENGTEKGAETANVSQAERHVKMLAVNSLQDKAKARSLSAENRLARVAEALKTSDVHVEMASDLTVNLTDRKTGIVRFEEKGIKR